MMPDHYVSEDEFTEHIVDEMSDDDYGPENDDDED